MLTPIPLVLSVIFTLLLSACSFQNSPFSDELKNSTRGHNNKDLGRLRTQGLTNDFKFGYVTDSHQDFDDFDKVASKLNSRGDLDFVVHGGDFTDFAYPSEYDLALDILDRIKIPLLMVIGNHDSIGHGKKLYRRAFGPYNFTLVFGTTKIIFWNNNLLEFNKEGIDFDWLEVELNDALSYTQVILIQHIDPFNKDYFGSSEIQRIETLLNNSNIDLLLNGHRHKFGTETFGSVLIHQTSRAKDQKYSIIGFSGGNFVVQDCKGNSCSQAYP